MAMTAEVYRYSSTIWEFLRDFVLRIDNQLFQLDLINESIGKSAII
jgi:hypothetical protein